jgi:glycosyltransferase involved in cell wall biosynthesis
VPYDELPGWLRAFDVCLLPYCLDEFTRKINPVKAMEYMAGGKPIVSTPIPDVVRFFGEVALIAEGEKAYIQLIEDALAGQCKAEVESGLSLAAERRWEDMAREMEERMLAVLHQPRENGR